MVRSGRGPFRPSRARRARAMHEFFSENLRNPARDGCPGLMHQFRPGQVYNTVNLIGTELAHQARAEDARGIS